MTDQHRSADTWLPISTAPKEPKPFNMFVVIALEVQLRSNGAPYTSDPWCVWVNKDGSFARWPHSFAPTHWCPLPEYNPRRPKPLSLKAQALKSVAAIENMSDQYVQFEEDIDTIRLALEALDD